MSGEKVGYFEEKSGKKSSMRLMSFASLIMSGIFGLITVLLERDGIQSVNGIYITFGFLLGAFAPKTIQKFAETALSSREHELTLTQQKPKQD